MTKEEDITEDKTNYLKIFIIIAIILILITIAFPIIMYHSFTEWTDSGTFGDSFGALNTLFSGLALTGVIVTILIQRTELVNQRNELRLQRTEMKETRKEFLMNRTTNLVYKQLDRFENILKELEIRCNGITHKGNNAISFLDENKETVYKPDDKSEEKYKEEMKKALISLLNLYVPNKLEIEKFANISYNSVEVLKQLIYRTNLEIDELNELKNLFFINIGFTTMGVIERISEVIGEEIEYLDYEDYANSGLEVGQMMRANIFLKPIVTFYHLKITKDNFNDYKAEWIKNKGHEH